MPRQRPKIIMYLMRYLSVSALGRERPLLVWKTPLEAGKAMLL